MKKIYLLLLMLIVGVGSTWADVTVFPSVPSTKVTSTSDISSNKTYVLKEVSSGSYAFDNTAWFHEAKAVATFPINEAEITESVSANALTWKIAASGEGYTFESNNTSGRYIQNGITLGGYLGTDASSAVWTLTQASEAGKWYLTYTDASSNTKYLGVGASGSWWYPQITSTATEWEIYESNASTVTDVYYNAYKQSLSTLYSVESKYGVAYTSYSTNADQNTTGTTKESTGISGLTDNNKTTYFHSSYENGPDADHYMQVDLGSAQSAVYLYMYKRANNANFPKTIVVSGSNDNSAFTDITTLTNSNNDQYFSDKISFGTNTTYRYVRFTVTATNTGGKESSHQKQFFTASEFYVIPSSTVADAGVEAAKAALAITNAADATNIANYITKYNAYKNAAVSSTNIQNLDARTNTKTYAIKNMHTTSHGSHTDGSEKSLGYLVYTPSVSTTNVAIVGNEEGGSGNTKWDEAYDGAQDNNVWQILKGGDNYYLYNKGAGKFMTRPGDRTHTFVEKATPIQIYNNSGVFGFNKDLTAGASAQTWACIAVSESSEPVRNWTASDQGSQYKIYEATMPGTDLAAYKVSCSTDGGYVTNSGVNYTNNEYLFASPNATASSFTYADITGYTREVSISNHVITVTYTFDETGYTALKTEATDLLAKADKPGYPLSSTTVYSNLNDAKNNATSSTAALYTALKDAITAYKTETTTDNIATLTAGSCYRIVSACTTGNYPKKGNVIFQSGTGLIWGAKDLGDVTQIWRATWVSTDTRGLCTFVNVGSDQYPQSKAHNGGQFSMSATPTNTLFTPLGYGTMNLKPAQNGAMHLNTWNSQNTSNTVIAWNNTDPTGASAWYVEEITDFKDILQAFVTARKIGTGVGYYKMTSTMQSILDKATVSYDDYVSFMAELTEANVQMPETGKVYTINGNIVRSSDTVKEYVTNVSGTRTVSTTQSENISTSDLWLVTDGATAGTNYIVSAADNTYMGFDAMSSDAFAWTFKTGSTTGNGFVSIFGNKSADTGDRYCGIADDNSMGGSWYGLNKTAGSSSSSNYWSTDYLFTLSTTHEAYKIAFEDVPEGSTPKATVGSSSAAAGEYIVATIGTVTADNVKTAVTSTTIDGYKYTVTYADNVITIKYISRELADLATVTNDKTYSIKNWHNTGHTDEYKTLGYLVYNSTVSETNVAVAGCEDTSHGTAGSSAYSTAYTETNNNVWQILKAGSNYYLYNKGAGKFMKRSTSDDRTHIFVTKATPIQIYNNSGTFGFNTTLDAATSNQKWACIAITETSAPVRNWTADDQGAQFKILEADITGTELVAWNVVTTVANGGVTYNSDEYTKGEYMFVATGTTPEVTSIARPGYNVGSPIVDAENHIITVNYKSIPFYRFKGQTDRYICTDVVDKSNDDKNLYTMKSSDDLSGNMDKTIFYLNSNNKLIAYKNGNTFTWTWKSTTLGSDETHEGVWTIAPVDGAETYTVATTAASTWSSQIYLADITDQTYVNRQTSVDAYAKWTIETPDMDEYNVALVGVPDGFTGGVTVSTGNGMITDDSRYFVIAGTTVNKSWFTATSITGYTGTVTVGTTAITVTYTKDGDITGKYYRIESVANASKYIQGTVNAANHITWSDNDNGLSVFYLDNDYTLRNYGNSKYIKYFADLSTDKDDAATFVITASNTTSGSYNLGIENNNKTYYYTASTSEGSGNVITYTETPTTNASDWTLVEVAEENLPIYPVHTGKFYRLESEANAGYYIQDEVGTDAGINLATTATDGASIYYLDADSHLLNYNTGKYIGHNDDTYLTTINVGTTNADTYTISEGTVDGTVNFGTGTLYLYDGTNASAGLMAYLDATNWKLHEVTSLPFTFKSSFLGYATFCSPVPVQIPRGVNAYVSKIDDTTITLYKVENLMDEEGNVVVPANTGVLLYNSSVEDDNVDVEFKVTTADISINNNGFYGTTATENLNTSANTYYSLRSWTAQGESTPSKVGYYKKTSGTLGGFKSFIVDPVANSARTFTIKFGDEDTPTAIEGLVEALGLENENVEIYDINGRKLQNMQKGLNIVNGKKVIK